jgi:hypothetical protein
MNMRRLLKRGLVIAADHDEPSARNDRAVPPAFGRAKPGCARNCGVDGHGNLHVDLMADGSRTHLWRRDSSDTTIELVCGILCGLQGVGGGCLE